MINYDFKHLDAKLGEAREWLAREYKSLRTGRATPSILDSVSISAYGSMMPLKQAANISVEDARTIRVTPYDLGIVKDIERGISNADLGLGMSTDQSGVRVTFPELTGERRQELIKVAKAKLEDARTAVRIARDEVWKDIQEKERASELTEDDKFTLKEQMQKKVDDLNAALENAFDAKEKEMSN
jgi:ribosome recycling factor